MRRARARLHSPGCRSVNASAPSVFAPAFVDATVVHQLYVLSCVFYVQTHCASENQKCCVGCSDMLRSFLDLLRSFDVLTSAPLSLC